VTPSPPLFHRSGGNDATRQQSARTAHACALTPGKNEQERQTTMILDYIPQDRIPHWIATNRIIGLALDRQANGKIIAAEVRRDEEGELRVPIAEMTTADFYSLASRLNLPIMDSRIASEQELASHRQAMRRLSERLETAKAIRSERGNEGWRIPEQG